MRRRQETDWRRSADTICEAAVGGVAALGACDGGVGGRTRCGTASARRTGGAASAGRKLEMVMEKMRDPKF